MNKKFFLFPLLALAISTSAQSLVDPVLMTINGKNIHKSEFEYSYHKNGNNQDGVDKVTVEHYVPMFVDYKLKVAAAEAAGLDTLSSFKKEFMSYRDAQLTPYLVDDAFIDSVAYVTYRRTAELLKGKDMFESAHILIRVRQKDDDLKLKTAKHKADSIYSLLKSGADFEELARKHSDDYGSSKNGGRLPMVGPGTFVPEFEETAYSLQNGEISRPVLSPFGYHIIKMVNRKHLGTFTEMKPEIVESLKKQNIEEYSSEIKIEKLLKASAGRLTRETLLDSVMNAEIQNNVALRCLIQEYYDGLLLYEISKRQIWDSASKDVKGLEKWFKSNRKKYKWDKVHFRGYVFHCQNKQQKKALKKILKKYGDTKEWRLKVKQTFNQDSVTVSVSGPYLCTEGENRFIDAYVFGLGNGVTPPQKFNLTGVYGKKMKQPQSYTDVKAQVTSDYQSAIAQQWIDSLHHKFTYSVNEDVLKTIK